MESNYNGSSRGGLGKYTIDDLNDATGVTATGLTPSTNLAYSE